MAGTAAGGRRSSEWACGQDLETAAHYVQTVRRAPTLAARARAVASREGTRAVRSLLRQLPRRTLPVSATPAGRELRAMFRPERPLPFDRAPVAVLDLPASREEYLRGRPRQALRTNLARASAEGVTCAPVGTPAELHAVATAIADSRRDHSTAATFVRPGQGLAPERVWSAAYDGKGDPVALSHSLVDRDNAGLLLMISALDHPAAPLARYALHTHVVGRLVERDVSTLTVGGSMLLTSPGTRYFQRRTGFGPVHLQPAPVARSGRGPRTLG
ncbi:hypothetical protein [Blastococcus sp. SYSU D00695]